MLRPSLRKPNQMRHISMETGVNKWAEGSCLIKVGGTQVLCTASVDFNQPTWKRMQNKTGGWVTAEYAMLPRANGVRKGREAIMKDNRSAEISRLIGRSLRSVVDMEKLGKHTITIDCDVIQADGGTRCASITGAFVAVKCDDSEDRELEIKVRLTEINDEFQKAMSLVSVDDDNNLVIEQRLTLCFFILSAFIVLNNRDIF